MTDDIDLDALQRPGPFPGDPNGDYPTLHDWKPLRSGSGIRLSGSVINHPELPDGEVVTSPLREIASDRTWCWTFGTLYMLGEQAKVKRAAEGPRLPLSAPLRDRLRIVGIPHPGIEHVPVLVRGIVADIMSEKGAERFAVPLDGDELEIAATLWKGGSIRKLRAIVGRLLSRRDKRATRH